MVRRHRPRIRHGAGFWLVAATFLIVMAYSTVPTPLYPLYQQRDGFPTFVITAIFAAYAVGVIVSLYFAGHISDWLGRRRILVVAVLISAVSALLFLMWADVPGLIAARFINGVSIGIITATATAHLGELRSVVRPEENSVIAASVSGAANLGGLSLGPLIGGLFATFLAAPLELPHLVFLVVLLASAVALLLVPETVKVPDQAPRYRPQRLSVPAGARSPFLVAAFGAFSGFAVLGLFTSLAPTFLISTFMTRDHLIAGATSFAVFAAAAAGQLLLSPLAVRTQFGLAIIACSVGLPLVAVGALLPQLAVFIAGGAVAGLGVGLLFKGAVSTAMSVADPLRKGETLALIFLIAYAGLAIPALLVGAALSVASATVVLLVFLVIVLAATTVAAGIMRQRAPRIRRTETARRANSDQMS
ncbi:MFS transporter [Leifsonia sp. 22587]|uniref:MFS transporter n=1 Tax=Leifsonia sp. 22587 TaxID=3453946 RepID=UPI003F8792A2